MHRLGLVLFGLLLTVVASPSVAQPGFERGVETARDDPAVLVNLGRAHAQADHFLSAIAYFEAYLAAASQPPAKPSDAAIRSLFIGPLLALPKVRRLALASHILRSFNL